MLKKYGSNGLGEKPKLGSPNVIVLDADNSIKRFYGNIEHNIWTEIVQTSKEMVRALKCIYFFLLRSKNNP